MFKLRNYGNSRKLPHEGMFVEIAKGQEIETEDLDLAMALKEYPYIDLKWPKDLKDQMKFRRFQLMRWAASLGIPGNELFFDDKKVLIGKISEVLA